MSFKQFESWKVCIRCMTYNHAQFIIDAINGFIIQKTAFPFIVVIVDDASTDGENEVIKNYIEENFTIIKQNFAEYEETDDYKMMFANNNCNHNCFVAVYYLKYNHNSTSELRARKLSYISKWNDNAKYVAWCEGDDFWIDPGKLQMQVDILDSCPDYSMVYTGFKTIDKYGNEIDRKDYISFQKESKTGWIFARLLNHNFVLTNTVCARNAIFSLPLYSQSGYQMDYAKFLFAASQGKCFFVEQKTTCYRKVDSGAMATQNGIIQNKLRLIHDYYAEAYIANRISSLPIKEKMAVNINLTLFYIALFFKEKDKRIFILLKKKPSCLFLLPISLGYACVMKLTRPGYSFVVGHLAK